MNETAPESIRLTEIAQKIRAEKRKPTTAEISEMDLLAQAVLASRAAAIKSARERRKTRARIEREDDEFAQFVRDIREKRLS